MADSVNTHDGTAGAEPAEHTQAMLDKAAEIEKNNNPDRPEWLPEKFESPEAMAQAYSALESKLGRPPTQEQPEAQPEEVEAEATPTDGGDVAEVLDNVGLDFDVFQQEYDEAGELSTDAYAALEQAGFPRSLVDTYIEGQEALSANMNTEMFAIAGGEEGYQQMLNWATESLPSSEIDAFNATIDTGDPAVIRLAIQGLNSRYRSESGSEPNLVQGSTDTVSGGKFESAAELTAAMRDPRYAKDSAYRASVAKKLSRSSVF